MGEVKGSGPIVSSTFSMAGIRNVKLDEIDTFTIYVSNFEWLEHTSDVKCKATLGHIYQG